MSTLTLERPSIVTDRVVQTSNDKPEAAHIVAPKDDKTAKALLVEAVVEGLAVEALCGYVWVPHRDPRNLPVCEECKDIYNGLLGADGDAELPDA